MNAKVGMYAGDVWTALNQNGELDVKELKKAAKLKTEKDLYLALGWLLREDKLVVAEDGKTMKVAELSFDGLEIVYRGKVHFYPRIRKNCVELAERAAVEIVRRHDFVAGAGDVGDSEIDGRRAA